MQPLRTPDARFEGLADFPFAPRYVELDGLRLHYVDEGPPSAPPVLMLHGEPTWSYLYRKMIPVFVRAGFRAIAPDLVGFGRSDKPATVGEYSYQRHVDWMAGFVRALDLGDVTLVCQDWGSLIGLRLVAEQPERFARVSVGNGFLPAGQGSLPPAFRIWRAFALHSPVFPIGLIVRSGCVHGLPAAARAAYDAPFPSAAFKAGARAFPALVPDGPADPSMPANLAAWAALGRFTKPFLCVFGARDPILGRADRWLIRHVPGAAGQPHARLNAGHFLQEDAGPEWAERVSAWAGAPCARPPRAEGCSELAP